jgi:hypothetical protein
MHRYIYDFWKILYFLPIIDRLAVLNIFGMTNLTRMLLDGANLSFVMHALSYSEQQGFITTFVDEIIKQAASETPAQKEAAVTIKLDDYKDDISIHQKLLAYKGTLFSPKTIETTEQLGQGFKLLGAS